MYVFYHIEKPADAGQVTIESLGHIQLCWTTSKWPYSIQYPALAGSKSTSHSVALIGCRFQPGIGAEGTGRADRDPLA
jgi:hypothetical protein